MIKCFGRWRCRKGAEVQQVLRRKGPPCAVLKVAE